MANTKVILTSAWGGCKNAANWSILDNTITDKQKQEFLDLVLHNNPRDNDGDCHSCGFNLYYDNNSVNIMPYDVPKKIHPVARKNAENELVIEIIPLSKKKCGALANYQCPTCFAAGGCTSPFIRKYIGGIFFPGKYVKEK